MTRQPAVHWSTGQVTRRDRWRWLGLHGGTVWLTGPSGSGKSSIAKHIEADFVAQGQAAYILDGDNLRHGLNADLGFTREDRGENARRAAEVAKLLADAGVIVLVALISPYAEDRAYARKLHEDVGLHFVEVFVSATLSECEARDPKGLYAQARSGEIADFTMVADPYEVPDHPDLVLHTGGMSVEDGAHQVMDLVRAHILG
jgi:adenylyl-sulfate kinase